ncbi:chain-length determining protein [Nitrincola sp. MINF-07-Sa-05]|uniref:chain-length determining protein n=1 Tax=Nitrincola salilacus TaxID=3400273 RepID=UPI0039184917
MTSTIQNAIPGTAIKKAKAAGLLKKYPYLLFCLIAIAGASIYWSLIASDRYVSEANVVLESPQLGAASLNFQSILSGGGPGRSDMLLLRDHLMSVDMLNRLQLGLDIRTHFADSKVDYLSRLSSADVPTEELHKYFLKRVSVDLDEYAQVLRIRVEAFDPNMAQAITDLMLSQGEAHMNIMGKRLAEEQVRFLEAQVNQLKENLDEAIVVLIDYQNESGLVSPQGAVESISAVVAGLESQLATLSARRTALLSYQSLRSPEILRVDSEIQAVNEQIRRERARMAQSSGGALNTLSSEYQALELRMKFAMESYSAALMALENTRIEAARKLKQVSVLQSPTFPEYPVEPRRIYNITVFTIITLFFALIAHMLVLIIKDHRD